MSSLVASAWLDKDLKYTLRFVSKSVFGFFASIALVVRTVEWTNYKEHDELKECQDICNPGVHGNFTEYDVLEHRELCDNQELSLGPRFAGHSNSTFLRCVKNKQ